MIILGETPQARGDQLERLTKRLLESLNFTECTLNVIASGAEIDVRGYFDLPGLGGTIRHTVICECKAIKSMVDMTQRHKFLGKLYHHALTGGAHFVGCFIALSGVNGYVQDNFDSIKHTNKVQLLTGDPLTEKVTAFYNATPKAEIIRRITAITNRLVSSVDLAICNDTPLWLVQLSATEFTVVGSDGTIWKNEDANKAAIDLIHTELSGSRFVDLNEEARLLQRRKDNEAIIIVMLAERNGEKTRIGEDFLVLSVPNEELFEAAKSLYEKKIIEYWEYKHTARLPVTKRNELPTISMDAWRVIAAAREHINPADSKFLYELINDEFLNDISAVQGNLPIPEERRPIWIKLLRLSRTSIRFVVNPIEYILTHRKEDVTAVVDQMDVTAIEDEMLTMLLTEYRTIALGKFFNDRNDIREMEIFRRLVVKTSEGVHLDLDVNGRYRLAPADEAMGVDYIPILLRPNHSQPWEPDDPMAKSQAVKSKGVGTNAVVAEVRPKLDSQ